MRIRSCYVAEFIGTFILVFGGLTSVALAVTVSAFSGLFQVAAIWGISLTIAIYACGSVSGSHLNPAISLAFAFHGDLPKSRLPGYIVAQMLGAFVAAAIVYALFHAHILHYEHTHAIERGSPGSEATAMIFGEYFPNPEGKALSPTHLTILQSHAFFAELLGTALLAFAIFTYTHKNNQLAPSPALIAPAIGATLAGLICLFAPLTMAGFNPARDLAPRIFSAIAGWGNWSFEANGWGVAHRLCDRSNHRRTNRRMVRKSPL